MARLVSVCPVEDRRQPGEARPDLFSLSWHDLHFRPDRGLFRSPGPEILNGVSGQAPAGALTAVLGPSGSGKTTLLGILGGFRTRKYRGRVLVDGKEVSAEFYRRNSSYVPQDTFLFPHLTVEETLMVAANLKLPASLDREAKRKRVAQVLQTLMLSDSRKTRSHRLSGGERRRVGIAQELVNDPPVFILDEPTSGLDSTLAYQCIRLLGTLASQGRTVVCSIHQPSSSVYQLFHHLHVLSKGKCVYSGPREELVLRLRSCGLECPTYHNPADYALDVASQVFPGRNLLLSAQTEDWKRKFVHLSDSRLISPLEFEQAEYPTSFCNQFLVLLKRIFISTCNPVTLILYLLSEIILAALIGMIYRGSGSSSDKATANLGFLALTVLILTFAAILPTLLNFPSEKIGVVRECHNGWYCPTSYFLAKTVAELPINFILPSTFVALVYWLTGQSLETWRYLYFVCISVCLSLNAQSIPIIFGSLFSDKVTVFVVPVVCLPLLLFCNFFSVNNPLPYYLEWISKISPFALCYEGMLVIVYGFGRGPLECSQLCLFTPQFLRKILAIYDNNLYIDFAILGSSLVLLRLLGYLFFYYSITKLK